MRVAMIIAVFCSASFSTLHADTIHVPADQPTIQAGIDAAVDGDTVLVAPATYVEKIVFNGKKITVKSSDGPEVTVIDGNRSGSVVTFKHSEDYDSILQGFTITNGAATYDSKSGTCRYDVDGGGVYIHASSPLITENVIIDNKADFGGGGIACRKSQAIIRKNEVTGNEAFMLGAGIYCVESAAILDGNYIYSNVDPVCEAGGGIYCEGTPGPLIISNMIYGNNCGFEGGGIGSYSGDMTIVNNTIVGNWSSLDGMGGGILCNPTHLVTVTNTIVRDNSAHPGTEEIALWFPQGTLEVTYCNVRFGWPGEGNIDIDAVFVDEAQKNYHLSMLSPCINRGLNSVAPIRDIDREARIMHGTVDMGADEFSGTPALNADLFTLSESAGGVVNFYLFGGAPNGGRNYVVLGSAGGTVPGWPMPGGQVVLPLNQDLFTDIVFALLNTSVFQDFMGSLTWGSSTGWAAMNTYGPLPPGSAGLSLYFAYTLYNPFDFVSNPVVIEVVP